MHWYRLRRRALGVPSVQEMPESLVSLGGNPNARNQTQPEWDISFPCHRQLEAFLPPVASSVSIALSELVGFGRSHRRAQRSGLWHNPIESMEGPRKEPPDCRHPPFDRGIGRTDRCRDLGEANPE